MLVTDSNGEGAEKAAAEIRRNGGQAEACRVDIGSPEDIQRATKLVTDRFGRVDVLVNNAAYIGQWHDSLQATEEEWQGCLFTTLLGTQNFTRAVLPWMVKQKRGVIVLTSSIQGLVGCPDSASYTTAKAGLIGFAKSVACDFGRHNIRVNVLCPGPIDVPGAPQPGSPRYSYQVNNTLLHRVGTPSEVARAVLFLASDDSSFITGAVIPVDGGWTTV